MKSRTCKPCREGSGHCKAKRVLCDCECTNVCSCGNPSILKLESGWWGHLRGYCETCVEKPIQAALGALEDCRSRYEINRRFAKEAETAFRQQEWRLFELLSRVEEARERHSANT